MFRNLKGNGSITRCREGDFIPGRMGASMKDNTKWIRNMDLEYMNGTTGEV